MIPPACVRCGSGDVPYDCAVVDYLGERFAVHAWEVPAGASVVAVPVCLACAREVNAAPAPVSAEAA